MNEILCYFDGSIQRTKSNYPNIGCGVIIGDKELLFTMLGNEHRPQLTSNDAEIMGLQKLIYNLPLNSNILYKIHTRIFG